MERGEGSGVDEELRDDAVMSGEGVGWYRLLGIQPDILRA